MGAKRRKGGDKYSPRVCRYTIEFLGHDKKATCREIMDFLCTRTKQVPTTPQLANILSKSGYFVKEGNITITRRHRCSKRVGLWSVNTTRAVERGWLEPE